MRRCAPDFDMVKPCMKPAFGVTFTRGATSLDNASTNTLTGRRSLADTRNSVDDSGGDMHSFAMGRPKQFDERIQLTLVEGTTARVDALLDDGEYRLDFIRTAIETEIDRRVAELPERKRKLFSRKTAT